MNPTQLAVLINGQHTPLRGCHLSTRKASSTVQEKFASHPFCLVRQWMILDLEVSADQLNALQLRGIEPVVVYALCVVQDSRGRYRPGDWVRTSFQTRYDAPGFFLTKNTAYVLLGDGKRQLINIDDLNALMGK